ncbi:Translocation protein S62 [Rhodotorula mucilaginosa]|uniref:Translocation protein SEC62 n=1 Tax=Rhodotorula mucilaginosa TaxID=5537 RepID=A0A9P6W0P1_RHOMI|nr:Translocation protein S62 [Rhodotorula mucilaginosa]
MRDNHQRAPPELKRVVDWLRNKSGIKLKQGALGGKRVDYFKGKSAIKALRSPAYAKLKGVPALDQTSDEQAQQLLHSMIPHTFFLRIQRGPTISSGVKAVQIVPQQLFAPEEYYVWLVDPNPVRQLVLALGMVAVVLAGVMFPLWPIKMRIGVWYLSVAVLGLVAAFFGLAIVRLVVWLVTKVAARPGIWIFPNLFADVGFVDSFIPLWGWDVPPPKKKKSSSSKKSSDATGSGAGDGSSSSLRNRSGKKSSKKSLGLEDELQIEEATEGPDPTPHSGARIEEILEGEDDDDDE